MPFIHLNPMREFEKLSRELDSVSRNLFAPENRPRFEMGGFKPRVDIIENEKDLTFEAELPGIAKDDVQVSVNDDNVLTIRGEKKFSGESNNPKSCCRSERSFGQFERSFQLPGLTDAENISASFDNGVLTLTVPKLEPVKPKEKSIEIK